MFCIFNPTWGDYPNLTSIFFRWVERVQPLANLWEVAEICQDICTIFFWCLVVPAKTVFLDIFGRSATDVEIKNGRVVDV